MANYSKVLLMGRLTRDPELRYTPQGMAVADLGLAINREFQGASSERRKEVVFVDVTFWSRRAEVVCQYFKKGDPIFVEGRLAMDTWETRDGQRRSKLKVVASNFEFLSVRGERDGGAGRGGAAPEAGYSGGDSEYTDYEYRGPTGPSQPAGGAEGEGVGEVETVDESDIPF